MGTVRHHIDVVRLDDELGGGIALRLPHHFIEFGVVAPGLEALVALLLGGIAPDIDKRILGADAQFGVALHRNPVTHIRDPVPRENSGRAACETFRKRISLAGLRGVHTQFEEPWCLTPLGIAPAYSG